MDAQTDGQTEGQTADVEMGRQSHIHAYVTTDTHTDIDRHAQLPILDAVSDGHASSMQQCPKALVGLIALHLVATLLHLLLQQGYVRLQVGV